MERFPIQVVTAWLGNTPTIALKHYLQVTEDHFQTALNDGRMAVQNPVQQPPETPRNDQKEGESDDSADGGNSR